MEEFDNLDDWINDDPSDCDETECDTEDWFDDLRNENRERGIEE